MTTASSIALRFLSILCLKQLQVVGVAETFNDGELRNSSEGTRPKYFGERPTYYIFVTDMTKPEQELLAKYLLQQLISHEEEEQSIADPIIARLSRGDDLVEQGSQTIATIVPAPPGIESTESKSKDQCKFPLSMWRGWVNIATHYNSKFNQWEQLDKEDHCDTTYNDSEVDTACLASSTQPRLA